MSGGFTLIELMVVVVLIAILALIASPAMRTARDDRLVFDYARQTQQLAVRARARAVGTGGAQLLVASAGTKRGVFRLFEALEKIKDPGPNPSSSCKTTDQWKEVSGWASSADNSNAIRFVDGLNLDGAGVNDDANVLSAFQITAADKPDTLADTAAVAICVSGGGVTYAGGGSTIDKAIEAMVTSLPFKGVVQITLTRGGGIGLSRDVLIAGDASPRVRSR